MTILSSDVKFVASQVMDDADEGGGAPTGNVINDATSNNIFPDISELDRAGGRVNMRKVHVSIATNNTDGYFGGNVIVAEPPNDPLVSVTLFTTRDVFDRRTDAANRVESYFVAGAPLPGFLYENHVEGQRSIQLFQRVGSDTPAIGRTLCLRYREGQPDQREQYVRVTRVESETRIFFYAPTNVDYEALVVTCDISDALRYDFPGTSANRAYAADPTKTSVRDTNVADAGSYFGIVPLTEEAEIGDFKLKASSVYTQLVPNSRTETSLIDQIPANAVTVVLATTPRRVEVGGVQHSQRIRIAQENRGFNYVSILTPLPAPGSCRVTFRALGQTYSIIDNGDGTLSGSGAGTINYTTGSISVTLAALPDDRSNVVFNWGENTTYVDRSGSVTFRAPEYSFELQKNGITPGSLSIEWTSGGVTRTATDNGSGKITGDATGEVVYGPGYVNLRPSHMPDAGGEFAIDYTWSDVITETKSGLTPDSSGVVNFTLTDEPLPKTILCRWITTKQISITSGSTASTASSEKTSQTSTTSTVEKLTKQEWRPPVFESPAVTSGGTGFYALDEYGRSTAV